MHAILFSIAATSAFVDATITGPVNRVPDAAQNVPGCLTLGDQLTINVEATTNADRRIVTGDASLLVEGKPDGRPATYIGGEPFNALWQLSIRYPRGRGETIAAGFPVPSQLQWEIMDTNCVVFAAPMTWDVTEYPAGDANMDGVFNSNDLVQVFMGGKYDTFHVATWSDGDWNADRVFDSSDLVAAFDEGAYTPTAIAVPEPSAILLLLIGLLTCEVSTPFPRLRHTRFSRSRSLQ